MARTRDQLTQMNVPNPDFKRHYESRPVNLPSPRNDINDARQARRQHLDRLMRHQPIPGPIPDHVYEQEVFVTAQDNYRIPVTVYSPVTKQKAPSEGLPVIILMHEGGWRLGDRRDEEMNARLFIRELNCIVLNTEYRLAPENRFPNYVEDCYTVLEQFATKPQTFHELANPQLGIVLGGSSAGGNLSAVLAQKARVAGLQPPVTGQWLSVPALLPKDIVPEKYAAEYLSPSENQDDPVIGPVSDERWNGMHKMLGIESVDDINYTPFASSIYPPKEQDKGQVARAFFQVAGMDPLRDHALIYERSLRQEWAVETNMKLYEGYGHMFWTNWPEMQESKQYWKDMVDGMRWLLRQ